MDCLENNKLFKLSVLSPQIIVAITCNAWANLLKMARLPRELTPKSATLQETAISCSLRMRAFTASK